MSKKLVSFLMVLLINLLIGNSPVYAQDSLIQYKESITLEGNLGETITGTIILTANETKVTNLSLKVESPLEQTDGDGNIPVTAISFTPDIPFDLEPNASKEINVQVVDITTIGNFEGSVIIDYDEKPDNIEEAFKINLTVKEAGSGYLPEIQTIPENKTLTLLESSNGESFEVPLTINSNLEINKIELVSAEMNLEADNGEIVSRITKDLFTFNPQLKDITIPANGNSDIKISVGNPQIPGKYTGKMKLSLASGDEQKTDLEFDLILDYSPEASLTLLSPTGIEGTSNSIQIPGFKGRRLEYDLIFEVQNGLNQVTITDVKSSNLRNKDEPAKPSLPGDFVSLLPSDALTEPVTIMSDAPGEVRLGFDFGAKGVKPGIYNGDVYLTGENFEKYKLPLEISVKDHWFWPLFILIVSVLVSNLLRYYQKNLKDIDELKDSISDLKEEFSSLCQNNIEFENFFGDIGTTKLGHSEEIAERIDASETASLEIAKGLVNQVNGYWDKWVQHGKQLYGQFNRLLFHLGASNSTGELAKLITEIKKEQSINNPEKSRILFLEHVSNNLKDIQESRDEQSDGNALKTAIDTEIDNRDEFLDIYDQLRFVQKKVGMLPKPDELANTIKQYREFTQNLLYAKDKTDLDAVKNDLGNIENLVDLYVESVLIKNQLEVNLPEDEKLVAAQDQFKECEENLRAGKTVDELKVIRTSLENLGALVKSFYTTFAYIQAILDLLNEFKGSKYINNDAHQTLTNQITQQSEKLKLITKAEDTVAITTNVETTLSQIKALCTSYLKIDFKIRSLEKRLGYIYAGKMIGGEDNKKYKKVIEDNKSLLQVAKTQEELSAIDTALKNGIAMLKADYETQRDFLYKHYKDQAIEEINTFKAQIQKWKSNQNKGNAIVNRLKDDLVDKAINQYEQQIDIDLASRLSYQAYLAAWFGSTALNRIQSIVDGLESNQKDQEKWKSVITELEKAVDFLISFQYHEDDAVNKLRETIEQHITVLYDALNKESTDPFKPPLLPIKKTKGILFYEELKGDDPVELEKKLTDIEKKVLSVQPPVSGAPMKVEAQPHMPPKPVIGKDQERENDVDKIHPGRTRNAWRGFLNWVRKCGDALRKWAAGLNPAEQRLFAFESFVGLLVVILVTYLGYIQLYHNNTTFGDDGLLDYIPLFFWGFVSEISGSTITSALTKPVLTSGIPTVIDTPEEIKDESDG